MGGTNDEDNLVDLFAREHFEAHRLLALENPDNDHLVYAWNCMAFCKNNSQNRYALSPEEYEEVRRAYAESIIGTKNPSYGKPLSEETKRKIRDAHIGLKPSEEARRKMSESGKNKAPASKETREKIRQKAIQRWKDPDYKKMILESKAGFKHSTDSKERISDIKGGKPVIQYSIIGEYLREYKYINDAAHISGINSGSIYNACVGKSKIVGGYRWRFIDNPLTADEIEELKNEIQHVKGVYEDKRFGRWRAVLNQKHIGMYDSQYSAIIARLNAEILLYGYDNSPQKYLFEQYGIVSQNNEEEEQSEGDDD